jgi:hypothetical protein
LAVSCFGRTPRRLSERPSPSPPDPRRTPHRGAAHRVTPAGGIGMGTAIVAGFNLAWKMSWLPEAERRVQYPTAAAANLGPARSWHWSDPSSNLPRVGHIAACRWLRRSDLSASRYLRRCRGCTLRTGSEPQVPNATLESRADARALPLQWWCPKESCRSQRALDGLSVTASAAFWMQLGVASAM